jgi:hypothetical protein
MLRANRSLVGGTGYVVSKLIACYIETIFFDYPQIRCAIQLDGGG